MDFVKTTKILVILIVPLLAPVLSMEDDYSDNFMWIIKCCDENFIMNKSGCVFNNSIKLAVPVYETDHVTRDSMKLNFAHYVVRCVNYEKENFMFQPQFSPNESFFIQSDGRLWVPTANKSFGNRQFCLEYFEGLGISALICIPGFLEMPEKVSDAIGLIGGAISVPFLLVTFVVYALLPQRNLHRKCFTTYIFTLFWAYFVPYFLFIYGHFVKLHLMACKITMMFFYFFLMVSFFWMNVIGFDIWLTFSGIRRGLNSEQKSYLVYSMYAWGMPILMVILVVTIDNITSLTAWYAPFGEDFWIKEGIPQLLYFYGPMGILIAINICFFVSTAWSIVKTRRQTAMLRQTGNKTHNSENEATGRFKLYVRLVFAMGINWSVELIQWAVEWQIGRIPYVRYLTEFCTGAQGLFIFFMFVFNRNTWKLLKMRYYMVTGKAPPAPTQAINSVRSTTSTRF